ncbi:MAG: hypothetical protein HUJ30_03595 [Gammaproteobacteria bacterium]|nr:hypothetical protein [Gammaproteobacteria bacterium]
MATKYADNRSFVKDVEFLNSRLKDLARVMNEVNVELKNIQDSKQQLHQKKAA